MKKILFVLSVLLFADFSSYAQAPQGINYQGVARDPNGNAYGNSNVSVQITFTKGGGTVYKEYQTVTTDTFGLYSIVIGSPSAVVVQGSFASIPWSAGNILAQVDIDPTGAASTWTTISTMNLQSVPYALYAQTSGNSGSGTVTNVAASAPLSVANPTSTPTVSISQAGLTADGYLSTTDWNNFNNKVSSITGGTGILSVASGQSYTLTADNSNAVWNANKILGVPLNVTAPVSNDILQYNGTAWVNATLNNGLPSGANGQMLYNNGSAWVPTNTGNLFFNGSDLGLGTTSPTSPLDVRTTASAPAISATAGSGPAIISNGPLQLNGTLMDAASSAGNNGDVLISQGPGTTPKWIAASSLGSQPWTLSGTTIYPSNLSDNIGIGTTSPNGMLGIVNTGTASVTSLDISNNSPGYGIHIINNYTGGGAPMLDIFHADQGSAAYISGQSASNSADILYVETHGTGNAIKGFSDNSGAGVIGYSHGSTTSSSGIYGLQDNLGSAGIFHVYNAGNTAAGIDVMTQGSGYSGVFTGGAGLQTDKIQITGGATNGYVLTSDPSGNATWQAPSGGGGLPAPQMGSILFGNSPTTWAATDPTQVSSDGMSITVTNTTSVGTAGTFNATDPSASNAPALLATTNSSTGYAMRADNNGGGAAIVANSSGFYAIAGNMSGGSGHGVAGWLRNNASGGYGIYGLVDNTSSGSAGYFENQNPSNSQTVMQVVNDPGSSGYSAVFSGGTGVQIDQLQVLTNLYIPLNANSGKVLTCDFVGNATWQAPPTGVSSISVNLPLTNTGTAAAPVLGIMPGDGSTDGYISVADWNTFNSKLSTVTVQAPLIGNGTGGAPLQVGLNSGNIFVGDLSNLAAPVNLSGDASITNTGVLTVKGLQGRTVSASAPAANQVLQYNGAQWAPTNLSGSAITGVWTTTGNTVLGTDYLGTTNAQPLTLATSNATAQPIIFKTGGTAPANEKMRIDAGGNVGIGATAPTTQLHVLGSNPEIRVESTGGAFTSGLGIKTATQQWFFGQENGAPQLLRIKDVTAGIVRMEIEKLNGNVGINKTNPAAQLDVASSSTVTTIAATNNGSAGRAGDFLINNAANTDIALMATTTGTGNAGYFSIGNAGNTNAVIYSTTNGKGSAGVFSVTNANGTGVALDVANQGLSQTGSFITNNSANGNYALNVATNGTGNAGNFQINNATSNATAVNAATTGGGIAVNATSNAGSAVNASAGAGTAVMARNTSNNATIDVANTGTGPAFSAISGGGNNSDVVKSVSTGSGAALVGINSGTSGNAGFFSVSGAGNSSAALVVNNSATGFSGTFGGGQGLKTDGFTADLKIVPNGGLVMGGTDYFFMVPNGTTGNLTLPPATVANKGKVYVVKTLGTGYNCGGGTTYTSAAGVPGQNNFPANSVVRLVCDGSAWQAW